MDQIIGSDYLKLVKQYERYEYLNKTLQISSGCKKYLVQRIFFLQTVNVLEFKYAANLQFVRIFMNTPTFDRIIKDQTSKLEDKISTIG